MAFGGRDRVESALSRIHQESGVHAQEAPWPQKDGPKEETRAQEAPHEEVAVSHGVAASREFREAAVRSANLSEVGLGRADFHTTVRSMFNADAADQLPPRR